jgi:hypothetical protein
VWTRCQKSRQSPLSDVVVVLLFQLMSSPQAGAAVWHSLAGDSSLPPASCCRSLCSPVSRTYMITCSQLTQHLQPTWPQRDSTTAKDRMQQLAHSSLLQLSDVRSAVPAVQVGCSPAWQLLGAHRARWCAVPTPSKLGGAIAATFEQGVVHTSQQQSTQPGGGLHWLPTAATGALQGPLS